MRRSMLFLPGNTPNIIMNADVLGADSVILDLEDAVAPDQKDAARILVRNTLKTMEFRDCEVIVRINPLSSGEWQQDLDEIIPCRPAIIMPTKISCSQDVQQIAEYMENVEKKAGNPVGSTRIMPLIETARGVENSYHIAEADPRVCAIFIGCEDLTADLCCERTKAGNEVFYARSRVVCAARAAGIDVYDTPFTDINDDAGLRKDAVFAKGLGYTGKACISPRQVDIVNEVFLSFGRRYRLCQDGLRSHRGREETGPGSRGSPWEDDRQTHRRPGCPCTGNGFPYEEGGVPG